MSVLPSIIQPDDLKSILHLPQLVLLDARVGPDSHKYYLSQHLKNARFIDLDTDMAATVFDASQGGRHPLPSLFDFAKTISELGIREDSRVIIYDDKGGANAAARCWWLLKAFGISEVQVVNGGFQALQNFEMANGEEHIHQSTIKIPNLWAFPTIGIEEVEESLTRNSTVIDVRDAYRYNGDSEPIDPIAGHIPGAINIPLSENLDESGCFLSPEVLKEKYQKYFLNTSDLPIVHCGSGVTACHTLLAMDYAGLPMAQLFVGSWSEWCRSGKTIAMNEN